MYRTSLCDLTNCLHNNQVKSSYLDKTRRTNVLIQRKFIIHSHTIPKNDDIVDQRHAQLVHVDIVNKSTLVTQNTIVIVSKCS